MRAIYLITVLGLLGCNRPSNANQCVPGATVECACMGGTRGVQACLAGGVFGACACPTTASAVAAPTAPAAPPAPAVPQVEMDVHAVVTALDAASRRVSATVAAEANRVQAESPVGCGEGCAEEIACRNDLTRRRHTEILSLEGALFSAIEVVNVGRPDPRACVLSSGVERVLVDLRAMELTRPNSDISCNLPAVTVPTSITDVARRLSALCPNDAGT
jgi:hypothetical protein